MALSTFTAMCTDTPNSIAGLNELIETYKTGILSFTETPITLVSDIINADGTLLLPGNTNPIPVGCRILTLSFNNAYKIILYSWGFYAAYNYTWYYYLYMTITDNNNVVLSANISLPLVSTALVPVIHSANSLHLILSSILILSFSKTATSNWTCAIYQAPTMQTFVQGSDTVYSYQNICISPTEVGNFLLLPLFFKDSASNLLNQPNNTPSTMWTVSPTGLSAGIFVEDPAGTNYYVLSNSGVYVLFSD